MRWLPPTGRGDARLNTRFGAAWAFGLALLAGPAVAQDGPLVTLMRPQPLNGPSLLGRSDSLSRQSQLFGDSPLTSMDTLSGEDLLANPATSRGRVAADPAKPGDEAAACDSRASARRRPTPSTLASAGSGPGEYGRFVEPGHGAGGKPQGEAARPAPGDAPLYGGTERPLWSDGAPRAAGQTAPRSGDSNTARGRAVARIGANGTRAEAASNASRPDAAANARDVAPAPGVDRPLWAVDGETSAMEPGPCDAYAGKRRAVEEPTQTLFFRAVPTR